MTRMIEVSEDALDSIKKMAEQDAKDAARYRKLRAGNYSVAVAKSILNDTPHGIDAAVDRLPSAMQTK